MTGAVAIAEDGPKVPDFVPVVVNQQQFEAVRGYLGGLRYSDAAPLVEWLNGLEAKARADWAADHAPKPVEDAPK